MKTIILDHYLSNHQFNDFLVHHAMMHPLIRCLIHILVGNLLQINFDAERGKRNEKLIILGNLNPVTDIKIDKKRKRLKTNQSNEIVI